MSAPAALTASRAWTDSPPSPIWTRSGAARITSLGAIPIARTTAAAASCLDRRRRDGQRRPDLLGRSAQHGDRGIVTGGAPVAGQGDRTERPVEPAERPVDEADVAQGDVDVGSLDAVVARVARPETDRVGPQPEQPRRRIGRDRDGHLVGGQPGRHERALGQRAHQRRQGEPGPGDREDHEQREGEQAAPHDQSPAP